MEKLFKLQERGTTISKEVIGGITTFLAMAYILAVNPSILADSGMSWGGVFTATAISAAIATFAMAFLANLPVALAPGLGLNAFFAYSVVLGMGCSWQLALTAVFFEGILFVLLSLCGVREAIVKSMTEKERKNPELLAKSSSRRERIAKGSGRPYTEVNNLIKRFDEDNRSVRKQIKK